MTLSDSADRILDFIRHTGDDAFNQEATVLRRVRPGAAPDNPAREDAPGLIPAGIVFILVAAVLFVVAVFVRSFRQHADSR